MLQLEHTRQVMRTKRADDDRHAKESEKRQNNRASLLREKSGVSRRAAAQRQDQSDPGGAGTAATRAAARENADLAPRRGKAAPVEAKARWAEPRRPGGSRKVLT
eukprot:COSAG06_NODE_3595_length_5138_cov_116.284382_10_plen_105_part_00